MMFIFLFNLASALLLTVSPQQSFEPATLKVTIQAERQTSNRYIEVVLDGDNYYRAAEIQLDGEASPKTFWLTFKDIPAGSYEITAILHRENGKVVIQNQRANVIAIRGS